MFLLFQTRSRPEANEELISLKCQEATKVQEAFHDKTGQKCVERLLTENLSRTLDICVLSNQKALFNKCREGNCRVYHTQIFGCWPAYTNVSYFSRT